MKKSLLIAATAMALSACGSSDDYEPPKITTGKYDAHYNADFYVLEGSCYDIKDAEFIIYKGVLYPTFNSDYDVTGNAFANAPFFGVATGSNIGEVSFEGTFDHGWKTIGGDWSSAECSGYFIGERAGDLSNEDKHHLNAL